MLMEDILSTKATILVVDDEPNIVYILKSNLERSGYAVITAFDGEEALQKAYDERPDLVLLDRMLPGMDGLMFAVKCVASFDADYHGRQK